MARGSNSNSTGHKAPHSGIWQPVNGAKEIALSEGDVFPPANQQATGYVLIRPTR